MSIFNILVDALKSDTCIYDFLFYHIKEIAEIYFRNDVEFRESVSKLKGADLVKEFIDNGEQYEDIIMTSNINFFKMMNNPVLKEFHKIDVYQFKNYTNFFNAIRIIYGMIKYEQYLKCSINSIMNKINTVIDVPNVLENFSFILTFKHILENYEIIYDLIKDEMDLENAKMDDLLRISKYLVTEDQYDIVVELIENFTHEQEQYISYDGISW